MSGTGAAAPPLEQQGKKNVRGKKKGGGRKPDEKPCANVCMEAQRNRTRTEANGGTKSGSRDLVANVGTDCEVKGTKNRGVTGGWVLSSL